MICFLFFQTFCISVLICPLSVVLDNACILTACVLFLRFGEQNECRIVKWVAKNFAVSDSIVDIGCGNGHLLVRLVGLAFLNCIIIISTLCRSLYKILTVSCLFFSSTTSIERQRHFT